MGFLCYRSLAMDAAVLALALHLCVGFHGFEEKENPYQIKSFRARQPSSLEWLQPWRPHGAGRADPVPTGRLSVVLAEVEIVQATGGATCWVGSASPGVCAAPASSTSGPANIKEHFSTVMLIHGRCRRGCSFKDSLLLGCRGRNMLSRSALASSPADRRDQPPASTLSSPGRSIIGGAFMACGVQHGVAWPVCMDAFSSLSRSSRCGAHHGDVHRMQLLLRCGRKGINVALCAPFSLSGRCAHPARPTRSSLSSNAWRPRVLHAETLHDFKQPLVLSSMIGFRQLLLWRWFNDSASIWVSGLSFIYLQRKHQQYYSVAGMFFIRWLYRLFLNRRSARSVHPGTRVFDAPAYTPHQQNRSSTCLSRRCCHFFGSQDLYVIRSSL